MILQVNRVTLGSIWGHLGITLGSFLAYGVEFGALSEPIRRRKASLKDTLGSLGTTLEHFFVALAAHWSHSRTPWHHLGALWGQLGVTLGHLGATSEHYGDTLGSLWG